MDGPSVNWAFFDLLSKQRNQDGLPELINIGSCSLHIVHGAFQYGALASDWGLKKILKALHTLFNDTSAWRAEFTNVTGSTSIPLLFLSISKHGSRKFWFSTFCIHIMKWWHIILRRRRKNFWAFFTICANVSGGKLWYSEGQGEKSKVRGKKLRFWVRTQN